MSSFFRSSAKKKIVISFDWHHDRDYRNLLSAWVANSKFDVDFTDLTPSEIDTDDAGRIKAVLTTKIRAATHTLVLIGKYANTKHADSVKIGTRNWIWWEIEKSKEEGKKLIAVKIESSNASPDPILGAGASWANSFNQNAILKAIENS